MEEQSVNNEELNMGSENNDCQKKLGFIDEDSDSSKDAVQYSQRSGPHHAACHRISAEEFEVQSSYRTKVEIQKLINSEAYAKAMQTKGPQLA